MNRGGDYSKLSETVRYSDHTAWSGANTSWSGVGLPPVGTICEYFFLPCSTMGEELNMYIFKDRAWVTVKVIMHYIDRGITYAVVHAPGLGFRGCSDTNGELFRPKSKLGARWIDNEAFPEVTLKACKVNGKSYNFDEE